ncbi:MAG: threonine/serine exporter family protein [Bacteroidaceae bacterium]|nr:threonine/serine exporter family protein [Bacteroidaceae bacterium]
MEDSGKVYNLADVMQVATDAGHIMLENGAEIFRVEETMERITRHFGVESGHFFVLSNGIITSGGTSYSNVEFIPFKGAQLEKVVEVNRLSREIESGQCTLGNARVRLAAIRAMKPKPFMEQTMASAIGSGAFCAIFGGSPLDCVASFMAGMILYAFVLAVCRSGLSKIVTNILGSMLATALCIVFYRMGFGDNPGNMIIGSIIPLIPGVPFTNGIRDLANEDYIAGSTRLTDALTVFFCIAAGVALTFLLDGRIENGIIVLDGMRTDAMTSVWTVQMTAAFLGTAGFAVLFGVPRDQYVPVGVCGMAGWTVYLLMTRLTGASVIEATFVATLAVVFVSRFMAVRRRCPVIVFQICGVFPLIPGAGIFWTAYWVVVKELGTAVTTGFTALGVTIAIVLGIIFVTSIPGRFFKIAARK